MTIPHSLFPFHEIGVYILIELALNIFFHIRGENFVSKITMYGSNRGP
jgi:hypothetical protein